jgi:hypothetical protein
MSVCGSSRHGFDQKKMLRARPRLRISVGWWSHASLSHLRAFEGISRQVLPKNSVFWSTPGYPSALGIVKGGVVEFTLGRGLCGVNGGLDVALDAVGRRGRLITLHIVPTSDEELRWCRFREFSSSQKGYPVSV